MDERTLVQRILAGDSAAERFFFDTFRPKLLRVANYLLGYHDPDVEDVVQESLAVAFREFPSYEHRGALAAWLRQICIRRCFERIRKRQQHVVSLDGDLESLSAGISMARMRDKAQDAKHEARLDILRREWDALEGPCRKLLSDREEGKMSYANIAEALKVPIGTVMSRLARCKEMLRERVKTALESLEKPDA